MEPDQQTEKRRGPRLDLIIAVCALLISSFATLASWSQMRATYEQTRVFEEQLSAQVWPYVAFSSTADKSTFRMVVENDGLGPAILRSLSVTVDGKPQHDYIELLHAVLGPHLTAKTQQGDLLSFGASSIQPGGVLRPGDSSVLLSLRSRRYARKFIDAYGRVGLQACYCAIVPGKCWSSGTAGAADPQPRAACPEIADDLLHEKLTSAFMRDL